MGRKRANVVYEYFNYNLSRNKSICEIKDCGHEVTGNHGTNLLSHLSSSHPDEFTLVMLRNKKRKEDETEINNSNSLNSKRHIRDKVLDECVNLVTVHGRPFSLINDAAFQKIVCMIPSTSVLSISPQEVRNAVKMKANLFRDNLSKQLNGRLLSLKIDAATCMDRSFVGINVQYVDGTEVVLNTLAVKEVYNRHTAENMKEILKNVLLTYGISINQIYSITTDNGSNMIKLVKLVGNDQTYFECDNAEDDSDSESLNSLSSDEIYGNENDEEFEFSLSVNEEVISTVNEKDDSTEQYQIRSVRCAAHTLQLAVTDVLKDKKIAATISEAREVCKKLRSPVVKRVLKAMHKKKPIIDCSTRWHSTLDMLERLGELKECCDAKNKDHYLSPQTWIEISDIVRCLLTARIATKKLQQEQLLIGDFYRTWSQCILETRRLKSILSEKLVEAMKLREKKLFNNDVFLAGMFLDVRFNIVLTEQQMVQAKTHLVRTWAYQEKILQQHRSSINTNCTPSTSIAVEDEVEVDEVENMLREIDRTRRSHDNTICSLDIMNMLRKFADQPRLDSKQNILEFWNKEKNNSPELYSLAQIALAVPPTQVSVERLFSSLKYVLSPLRYNLSDDIVNDILILRTNPNL